MMMMTVMMTMMMYGDIDSCLPHLSIMLLKNYADLPLVNSSSLPLKILYSSLFLERLYPLTSLFPYPFKSVRPFSPTLRQQMHIASFSSPALQLSKSHSKHPLALKPALAVRANPISRLVYMRRFGSARAR
jgi:hypothetical protein